MLRPAPASQKLNQRASATMPGRNWGFAHTTKPVLQVVFLACPSRASVSLGVKEGGGVGSVGGVEREGKESFRLDFF